ncbi:MAG: hypothetical protein EBY21_00655 [Alphaproteobacteria bacterium]|nr:hypothetical protein [Alphaproteobacteria bacterium]
MKKLAFAFVTAACLAAPVQAMAQTKEAPAKEAPAKESKMMATNEGWTSGQVLAIAGGAVVGYLAADILVPGMMMKNALGLIGGSVLGYYWYTNETPQQMKHPG